MLHDAIDHGRQPSSRRGRIDVGIHPSPCLPVDDVCVECVMPAPKGRISYAAQVGIAGSHLLDGDQRDSAIAMQRLHLKEYFGDERVTRSPCLPPSFENFLSASVD